MLSHLVLEGSYYLNYVEATFVTEIPLTNNRAFYDFADTHGHVRGMAKRYAFAVINQNAGNVIDGLVSAIVEKYNVDKTEAKYVIKEAQAIHKSQSELVDLYISEESQRIEKSAQKISRLVKKVEKLSGRQASSKRLNKVYEQLQSERRKLNKRYSWLENLKCQKSSKRYSVAFGTSELQRKQHNLKQNYFVHSGWLAQWRSSRSGNIYYEGSRNFAGGNLKARLIEQTDGTFKLSVKLPAYLVTDNNEHVVASGIKFHYGLSAIKSAMRPELIGQAQRNGTCLPVTHRLVFGSNGKLYLHTTVNVSCPAIKTDRNNGSLGIDLNARSVECTEIDGKGNYKTSFSIECNTQDLNSLKTEDVIGKICQKLVKKAVNAVKPIVIEELDFQKTKASEFIDASVNYKRMLSGFPYSKFREILSRACLKSGVELIIINPRYTSLIGVLKYMPALGLNSGTAAAYVIARRGESSPEGGSPAAGNWRTRKGLGFRDRVTKIVVAACKKQGIFVGKTAQPTWSLIAKKVGSKGGLNGARRRHEFFVRPGRTNSPNQENQTATAVRCKPT